jgi:hypothetical protein
VAEAGQHSPLLFDRAREFVRSLWGKREHFKLWIPMHDLPETTTAEQPESRTDAGTHATASALGLDVCEMVDGERWRTVDIGEALEIRGRDGRWPGGRCVECHENVRPHKCGSTEQRAHFEHLRRNSACSRSDKRMLASNL